MKRSAQIANYFPGLIILIFSMLALYSSLRLINVQNDLQANYNEYERVAHALEDSVSIFEKSYDEYESSPKPDNFKTVQKDFNSLTKTFENFQRSTTFLVIFPDKEYIGEYRRLLYSMQQDMAQFVEHFNQDTIQLPSSYEQNIKLLKHLKQNVSSINHLILENIIDATFTKESMNQKENWLYWSVITIGLTGFLLTILNARKMQQLKMLNADKKNTLEELQRRLAALEMARDGIFITNSNYGLIYVNAALCDISGLDPQHRPGMIDQSWSLLFSASDFEVIDEDIMPEMQERGYWRGEFPMYREDGVCVNTEMSLTSLPDGGLVGTIQDVTDKQKSEEEKKSLEDQFHQAQKMEAIGRLAGGIAHDFNNILASMNGYAEFLIEDLEDKAEQKQFAANILQAGLQARQLVDQMLAFSRRTDSSSETIDIISSVNEALSMLRATLPKTIELEHNYAIDHAYINGNQTQISQLIMNLCVNAQDAMEDEHGTLMVGLETVPANEVDIPHDFLKFELPEPKSTPLMRIEDLSPGNARLVLGHLRRDILYVKLTVKDTGTGMSRAVMEHIFEPFFTTKTVDKGTGLGLSTVHSVVASHCGAMIINSQIGQGTQFDLFFPVMAEQQAIQNENLNMIAKERQKTKPEHAHILLVEDQDNVREMMIKMLDRMGYQYSFATTGIDGIEMIRDNPGQFDIVITDHNMPKMTGLQMIQNIHPDFPDLPFIMLSGYSEQKMLETIQGHPAIKVILKKPVSRETLSKHIQDILRQKITA